MGVAATGAADNRKAVAVDHREPWTQSHVDSALFSMRGEHMVVLRVDDNTLYDVDPFGTDYVQVKEPLTGKVLATLTMAASGRGFTLADPDQADPEDAA